MITIKITDHSICMNGQPARRVGWYRSCLCCGYSTTCNLINSLKDLTGDRIRGETASGMTVIEWEDLSDGGKLLVDSWFLGIAVISQEYNCIQFE